MSNRFEQLLSEYLDGSLPRSGSKELAALIRNDPEKLQTLLDLQAQDRLMPLAADMRDEALFIGSIQEAIRQDERQFVGKVRQHVRGRDPSSRRTWIPVFALAASVLLGVAVFLFVRPDGTPVGLARVLEVRGELTTLDNQRLQPGSTARPGQTLQTARDSLARLVMPDGSQVDMDQLTTLTFQPRASSDALAVPAGNIYCRISPRTGGQRPMTLTGAEGHRMEVLGTIFELSVWNKRTALNLEKGSVNLKAGSKSTRVYAMESVAANGDTIMPSRPIQPQQIARWNHPDPMAAPGTVLFADDMESGSVRWSRSPSLTLVEGQGINGSRAVRVNSEQAVSLALEYLPRCVNYEVSFKIKSDQPDAFVLGIAMDLVQEWLKHVGKTSSVGSGALKRFSAWKDGEWAEYRITVHGRKARDLVRVGDRIVFRRTDPIILNAPISRIRLSIQPDTRSDPATPRLPSILIDDVVVRKIAGEKLTPNSHRDGSVLLADDFSGSLTNWTWCALDLKTGTFSGDARNHPDLRAIRTGRAEIRNKPSRVLEMQITDAKEKALLAFIKTPPVLDAFSMEFDTFLEFGSAVSFLLSSGEWRATKVISQSDVPPPSARWYRNRIDFIPREDEDGSPCLDVRSLIDGKPFVHHRMYVEEWYPAISLTEGKVRIANLVIRELIPSDRIPDK